MLYYRQVIRRRRQLVRDRIRIQNRIKAELRFYGVDLPSPKGKWTQIYFDNLRRIKFNNSWMQKSLTCLSLPFNNDWPSSIFASQDPVAIDSVGYDFLKMEWPDIVSGGEWDPESLEGSAQDYLHEAAMADDPPSGTFYDPEGDGIRMSSLGVHEHWNNDNNKQYSRNLGLGAGIELIYISSMNLDCTTDTDCNDGNPCTTDQCETTGLCVYTWPDCGLTDGCCGPDCDGTDPDCESVCGNGLCEAGEDCGICPSDCIGGKGGNCGACFKGICNGICNQNKEGLDCSDCAPSYCCGDGFCEGNEDGYNCKIDCGDPPICGDGTCDPGEDQCNCESDCGAPSSNETNCSDGLDNDCDGGVDCNDTDCSGDSACTCNAKGEWCSKDEDCCSNDCRGKKCK